MAFPDIPEDLPGTFFVLLLFVCYCIISYYFSHFLYCKNNEKEKEGEGPRGPQQVEQAVIDEVITVFKDIPGHS